MAKEAGYLVKLALFIPCDPTNPDSMTKAAVAAKSLTSVEGLEAVAKIKDLIIDESSAVFVQRKVK